METHEPAPSVLTVGMVGTLLDRDRRLSPQWRRTLVLALGGAAVAAASRLPASAPGPRVVLGPAARWSASVGLAAALLAVAGRLLYRTLRTHRERQVAAREEERHRLGQHLHDGLCPTLAGMSMQLCAARRLLPEDGRAADILEALAGDLRVCSTELRDLVDELQPPASHRARAVAPRRQREWPGSDAPR
jgi:signal transduction histidine kinase